MKKKFLTTKGFTLIELLTVIAIIGILAGAVLVSSQSSLNKSKKSSVLATVSSVLPELVACQDDNGQAKNSTPAAGELICCQTVTACADVLANRVAGHTAKWQDISGNGWSYGTTSGSVTQGTYAFTVNKNGGGDSITCDMQANTCN